MPKSSIAECLFKDLPALFFLNQRKRISSCPSLNFQGQLCMVNKFLLKNNNTMKPQVFSVAMSGFSIPLSAGVWLDLWKQNLQLRMDDYIIAIVLSHLRCLVLYTASFSNSLKTVKDRKFSKTLTSSQYKEKKVLCAWALLLENIQSTTALIKVTSQ